ncbi:MAG: pyruvate kinase [Eubacteriales bacterium]|nr:pyruvate kinase [Eubacteriales bacterium]
MALGRNDLRELQWDLMPLGLSSLGRLESRVMTTLDSVVRSCAHIAQEEPPVEYQLREKFLWGEDILEENSRMLLGKEPDDRYTRIMVTLDTQAAWQPQITLDLVARGMSVARINCAHDDEAVWQAMIGNVRAASGQLGKPCVISMEIPGPKVRIDRVLTSLRRARANQGDLIFLTARQKMGLPQGIPIAVSCSMPELMQQLDNGEPVIIDDGRVETVVLECRDDGVVLKATKVFKDNGVRVALEKGVNFPGSDYKIPLLSKRDEGILTFICQHADVIGCSFVRDEEDIRLLQTEINKRLEAPDTKPIIIKIETLASMRILPSILAAAAGRVPTGVMTARGDLAVEVGYARLSEYQEEIPWICEAAHVPVIWATQVVETMVKTGIPTRAEISDVTLAAKSECIMLNKGEHINDAIVFVDDILTKFEEHVYKKTAILRKLSIAGEMFGETKG